MHQRWGVAGADAHKHTITFAVLESTGGDIDVATFAIDPPGMVELLAWLDKIEVALARIGIEGSRELGPPGQRVPHPGRLRRA
jgi:hypothetical protein